MNADRTGGSSAAATLPSALHAGDRPLLILPERDWAAAWQEQHRYRGWVWPGGQRTVARSARQVAFETLSDWQLGPMADDVVLCVSELVSNALTHARVSPDRLRPDPVVLGLRYFPSSCLLVEVGDGDSRPPFLPAPAVGADPLEVLTVGGRGLVIVRDVAELVWWNQRATGGKDVYARLDTARYFGAGEEGCHG